jgi:hypothetical protein
MKRKIHVEIDMIVESRETDEDVEQTIEDQLEWMWQNGNLFCNWDIDDPEKFDVDVTITDCKKDQK